MFAHKRTGDPWPGSVSFQRTAGLLQCRTFKQCALKAARASGEDLRWFVIDTIPISDIYINGVTVLKDLKQKLAGQNVKLVLAERQSEIETGLRQIGEQVENVK